ncbi:transglutaminase family protein [bacterium]|nr:transglutaminase family protein [bacterium]
MLIHVDHLTRYRWSEPAGYSIQRLRLTPRPFDGQAIVEWSVDTAGIEKAGRFRDAFGNEVHLVSRTGRHDEIVVRARGTVETREHHGIVSGLAEVAPGRVFLRTTPLTRPDDSIRELGAQARGDDELARLHALMSLVREAIEYERGTTHGGTTAAQALALGRGVCQDHAHVFVSAARTLGIPARYVTGYMAVGEPGEVAESAHHAWAEAHVPSLGWVGFDVANRICPDELYVRLACGLDAEQAAPVRGSRRGGGEESLDVSVVAGRSASLQSQQ